MLAAYGRFIYRFRVWFLVIGLLAMIGGGVYAGGVYGSLSPGGFSLPGAQSQTADQLVNRYFHGTRDSLVVLFSSPRLAADNTQFAATSEHLLQRAAAKPYVTGISSYYSTHQPQYISGDHHETFALIGLKGGDTQRAAEATELQSVFKTKALSVKLGGEAAVDAESTDIVKHDLEDAERYTFPITAVLLVFIFGSLAAASLPLALGLYGVIGALVITRLIAIATPMSVYVLNLVSLLGLGLAIDYSLFIVTRYREEILSSHNEEKALERTMATAGKTVIFSGLTVLVALAGLIIFPVDFLRSMGIGGSVAVMVALLGALLFLPAILGMLGETVDGLHVNALLPHKVRSSRTGSGNWAHIVRVVTRWPVLTVVGTLAVLLICGIPFLHANFVNDNYTILPPSSPARQVGDALNSRFHNANQAPINIVIKGSPNSQSLTQYQQAIARLPNVLAATPPVTGGGYTLLTVLPRTPTYAGPTKQLVNAIRRQPLTGAPHWIGGQTADLVDLINIIKHYGIYALIIGLAAMLVLFFLLLGSVVIPLKTIILNVLSLSAAFGALVWIFQWGHWASWLGITPQNGIDATQPVIIFSLAFGLSMDYAIFLFSRVKERFDEEADMVKAISWGVQKTGGIITSAALLLLVVVGAFATGRIVVMKEVAIGLMVAIVVDVFVVRLLLVPSSMKLLGKHNWWAPPLLKKLHDKLGVRESG